jgi:peptidoglycan/xylan/chitin deacetylase (PgdA/CDA1 family)
MEQYQAKFTFPIVASIALKHPQLTREILRYGHEIAVHGYKHVRYTYLTEPQQESDIKMALDAFKKMGIPVYGFRAPYNTYTKYTAKLVEKYGFLWDGGIGFNPKYRGHAYPFRVTLNGQMSSFICIPLSEWSDDRMIEKYGFQSRQIGEALKRDIKWASKRHSVVMFDLHPIRIGQPQYIDGLRQALEYGTKLNGWFPTVTEAIKYWRKHRSWKHDAAFCCLMTGDIDNFVFLDYLQRLL